MSESIEIILVDDHKIILEGLANLIKSRKNLKLIAQCSDGMDALKLSCQFKPGIVIMDISMPHLNGIAATHLITTQVPASRVIALSMYSEVHFIRNMLNAGAKGYLQKNSAFDELIDAIHAVHKGKYYLSHQVMMNVAKNYDGLMVNGNDKDSEFKTGQKRRILQKLAEGYYPDQIAEKLSLDPGTVFDDYQQMIREWMELCT